MCVALKGINLGGWLIAERWMTPALFEGVRESGERAIGREMPEQAPGRLGKHRREFITEKDFKWIAAHGFDFVRLPVGYWLFETTESFVEGEEYVKLAFRWAEKHKLKVILDFHGLQGSQNGQDHSGQVGKVKFYKRYHTNRALATVDYLTRQYGHEPALLAIELINEPKIHWFIFRLVRYYERAYRIAQRNVAPRVKIIVSDAFKPLRLARALHRKQLGEQLVLDVHLYQLFSKFDKRLSYEDHIRKIHDEWQPLLTRLHTYVDVLVGEWSAALPGEALHQRDARQLCSYYYESQKQLFDELAWGHSYWSYKAPGNGPWDFVGYDFEAVKREQG